MGTSRFGQFLRARRDYQGSVCLQQEKYRKCGQNISVFNLVNLTYINLMTKHDSRKFDNPRLKG
jgi:hypothetical protein